MNYAGGASATTTAQFYAIASDLAQPVIDQLQDGDFESLGINGWAVYDEELGISGIWVAGVDPGSPAADAELLPGDIVTAMNGLPVGTDGTFKDYCDVLRTAGEGAPINVDVLRFDTSEVLRGEINGDQPIELAFSFAEEVGDEVGDDSGAAARGDATSRSPTTPVRSTWTCPPPGRHGTPRRSRWRTARWCRTSPPRPTSTASAAGGRIPASCSPRCRRRRTSPPRWPSTGSPGDCTDGGITDYSDPVFTGQYQLWQDCAGTTTDVVTLVALPADGSYTAVIQAQILTDADLEALDQAFDTFNSVVVATTDRREPPDRAAAAPRRALEPAAAARSRVPGRVDAAGEGAGAPAVPNRGLASRTTRSHAPYHPAGPVRTTP